MGFAGLNITYPCKQAVIPLLDELSPEAQAMGAVNTVGQPRWRLIGHNTDGSGWSWGFSPRVAACRFEPRRAARRRRLPARRSRMRRCGSARPPHRSSTATRCAPKPWPTG